MRTDKDYMRLAIKEAQKAQALGEVPIGAVIVKMIKSLHMLII